MRCCSTHMTTFAVREIEGGKGARLGINFNLAFTGTICSTALIFVFLMSLCFGKDKNKKETQEVQIRAS